MMEKSTQGFTLGIFMEPTGWEEHYIKACEELGVAYKVIDIISANWWDHVLAHPVDGYLVRAAGDNEVRKQLYNERLWFVQKHIGKPFYPNYEGILLYENKRMQAYWMDLHDIPHPNTAVLYRKAEALAFVEANPIWPLVSKPNLGGAGEGVRMLRSAKQARRLIRKVFTRCRFYNPGLTRWRKWRFLRLPVMEDKQHNYLIFQQYIPSKWEWRIIKVGNTYFGHQKLERHGLHSGSGRVGHVDPPKALFELVKKISALSGISAVNVDILEGTDGRYYVNEIQTFWGGRKPYQMKINGESCRYLDRNGIWELEYGLFHQNRGCNLRVADFLEQLKSIHKKPRA
jgi:glutathione synthase/RimK-type ligase-like ATP-grasp enzyme